MIWRFSELADLRDKAIHATFSARELDAVEPLLVLATRDPEARKRWLRDYEQAHAKPRLAEAATPETPTDRRVEAPATPTHPEPARGKVATNATPQPHAPHKPAPPVASPEPAKPAEDPARAEMLVLEAEAARRRGALSEAKRLFHQALSAHPRNVAALGGLSNLAFDEGEYGQAVDYGERAVKLASKDPTYRLRLGDAYFKVLRFGEARDQYTAAAELGHPRAQERLDKLQEKLGAP